MPKQDKSNLYEGQGQTGKTMKPYKALVDTMNPQHYLARPALQHAVNVALTLGQPLLVTGKPGTGKTELASSIAYEFNKLPLFPFHVKSTSVAQDLFYQYDAIRRFQDSHDQNKSIDPKDYIDFKALGLAILLTLPPKDANPYLPEKYQNIGPIRSVILLDEIDKAPRDLPNDILVEIEKMEFSVKELDQDPFVANKDYRPIVVITSNSEKNLPDAFLRRCVYYHIPFPTSDELKTIIQRRFQDDPVIARHLKPEFIDIVNNHFSDIQKLDLKKEPATAELLAWFSVIHCVDLNIDPVLKALSQPDPDITHVIEQFKATYAVLVKTERDLHTIHNFVEQDLLKKGHVYQLMTMMG